MDGVGSSSIPTGSATSSYGRGAARASRKSTLPGASKFEHLFPHRRHKHLELIEVLFILKNGRTYGFSGVDVEEI